MHKMGGLSVIKLPGTNRGNPDFARVRLVSRLHGYDLRQRPSCHHHLAAQTNPEGEEGFRAVDAVDFLEEGVVVGDAGGVEGGRERRPPTSTHLPK